MPTEAPTEANVSQQSGLVYGRRMFGNKNQPTSKEILDCMSNRADFLVDLDKKQKQPSQNLQTEIKRIEEIQFLRDEVDRLEVVKQNKSSSFLTVGESFNELQETLKSLEEQNAAKETELKSLGDAVHLKENDLKSAQDVLVATTQECIRIEHRGKVLMSQVTPMLSILNGLEAEEREAKHNLDEAMNELNKICADLRESRGRGAKIAKMIEERINTLIKANDDLFNDDFFSVSDDV